MIVGLLRSPVMTKKVVIVLIMSNVFKALTSVKISKHCINSN